MQSAAGRTSCNIRGEVFREMQRLKRKLNQAIDSTNSSKTCALYSFNLAVALTGCLKETDSNREKLPHLTATSSLYMRIRFSVRLLLIKESFQPREATGKRTVVLQFVTDLIALVHPENWPTSFTAYHIYLLNI